MAYLLIESFVMIIIIIITITIINTKIELIHDNEWYHNINRNINN